LSQAVGPFRFSCFLDRVSCFCPWPDLDCNLCTSASFIARITDLHPWFVLWDWFLLTFCLGYLEPQSSISTSQVDGITGMNHLHAPPTALFFIFTNYVCFLHWNVNYFTEKSVLFMAIFPMFKPV
jgi:hypothetical protein